MTKYSIAMAIGIAGLAVGLVVKIPTLVSLSGLTTGGALLLGLVEYLGSLPEDDESRTVRTPTPSEERRIA